MPSSIWATHLVPPVLTPHALLERSAGVNTDTLRKVAAQDSDKPHGTPPMDETAANEWLTLSPYAGAVPDSKISVRSGVKQKNKIRPIDNFKGSHLNAACGTAEKVTLLYITCTSSIPAHLAQTGWTDDHAPAKAAEQHAVAGGLAAGQVVHRRQCLAGAETAAPGGHEYERVDSLPLCTVRPRADAMSCRHTISGRSHTGRGSNSAAAGAGL